MKFTSFVATGVVAAATVSALPAQKRDVWADLRGKITHVVYLMMENHSFDNIAGYWDFHPDINNLRNISFCNNYLNPNWTVWNEPYKLCAQPYEEEVPLKDPDHNFAGTTFELFEKWQNEPGDVPTMGGFIQRQCDQYNATPGQTHFVIQAFSEKKTSLLAYLAKNYAFWDTYFAEHPGPTNVNRQFATSGSSCGFVDNTNQAAGFFSNTTGTNCTKSIFEVLNEKNITWKNYYEKDIVDAYMYEWTQKNAMNKLVHADEFYSDLANGTLPTFSYINPECCTIDSMHPTSNLAAGEAMIKHMYDAVRNSKYWNSTLIILNFDEHGGFADHVPPPMNVPAPQDGIKFNGTSDKHNVTYDFTRLGVRVPSFIISPWIAPNTLISSEGTMYAPDSAYTHSSFLHFLSQLWELPAMNNRVEWAKTFEYVFQEEMRTDTPTKLPTPEWFGTSENIQPAVFYQLNRDESYYAALP